jgi:D-serine deaminase-like pyridoxal phosphate-dependent protein
MEQNFKKQIIEISNKGFPLNSYGKTIDQFLSTKPNILTSGFQFPIMVLKDKALKHNIDRMARFCKSVGAELAPHVKTTMSPQIAQMQVDAGAFALTIANFWQAEIFRNFGFKKLIIANEVLDPTAIAAIADLNSKKAAEVIFYVDSIAGLDIIKKYTPKDGVQNLFIEIGTDNGRGGVRDLDLVTQIAKNISEDPRLKLRGVTGFEGAVPNAARTSAGEDSVTKFCQKIVAAANNAFLFKSESEFIISAGGSAYFEIVASELNKFDKPKILLLRSGGYVTHDSRYYEEIYPFRDSDDLLIPAIEVWAQVISAPEKDFGVLNLGKRDIGCDLHNPIPVAKYSDELSKFSGEIEKLNDQHGFMRSKEEFAVSELIGLGISHPCTTFDKWRLIPLVNDNYDVVDCIHTFF